MNKVNKYLGIINLILWTGLFISIFFIDYNFLQLKRLALGSTFIVCIDVFLDWIGNRDVRVKRKANLKLLCEIEDEFKERIREKQGDK